MSFKVAIIGAGSVGFTKTLISRPAARCRNSPAVEFALTDINAAQSRHDPADHRADRRGQQAAGQGHRHHRPPRGARAARATS